MAEMGKKAMKVVKKPVAMKKKEAIKLTVVTKQNGKIHEQYQLFRC